MKRIALATAVTVLTLGVNAGNAFADSGHTSCKEYGTEVATNGQTGELGAIIREITPLGDKVIGYHAEYCEAK